MFELSNFLLPHIANLQPYVTARHDFEGKANTLLDANENPYGSASTTVLNRYPDPTQRKVKEKIAALKNVSTENIFLGGGGSDEAIDLLFKICCSPGLHNIIIQPPTYGMYKVSADTYGVETREAYLSADDFQPNLKEVEKLIDEQTRIIFFCSPNNPTGGSIDRSILKDALKLEFNGLIVIDEAYADFTEQESFVQEVQNHPNLLVLQTFSKAWGMAGLRMGMAFAHSSLIEVINKVKLPYNVSSIAQQVALSALEQPEKASEFVRQIKISRTALVEELQKIPQVQKIHKTDSNQLLVEFIEARKLYTYLVSKGIVVRDRSSVPLCANCLRISIGLPEENTRLISEIQQFYRSFQE